MKIEYDPEAAALYIQLRQAPVEDNVDIEDGVSVDLDGDKIPELITGKRFYAHGKGGDPGWDGPLFLSISNWSAKAPMPLGKNMSLTKTAASPPSSKSPT